MTQSAQSVHLLHSVGTGSGKGVISSGLWGSGKNGSPSSHDGLLLWRHPQAAHKGSEEKH